MNTFKLPMPVQRWCRFTSPSTSKQPQWREELASLIMPIDLLLVALALPAARTNTLQFFIMVGVIVVIIVALVLKRHGYFVLAGILSVCAVEVGLAVSIVAPPTLSVSLLPLYALLVQPGFIVVAFFSPVFIFILCGVNVVFALSTLILLRKTSEFALNLAQTGPDIVFPMVNLQIFVAIITWILMSTVIRAILRADRAEVIVSLERTVNDQQQRELALKEQMEQGIQTILISLNEAATQGDFSVRVPLSQESILWRISNAINMLMTRLQRFRHGEAELERTRNVAQQFLACIQTSQPFPLQQWTGTCLDPLILEHNKKYALSQSTTPKQSRPI
jgi:hypothetical protein